MDDNFTDISQGEWDNLANNEMSPSQVVEYFYRGIRLRSFSDVLKKFGGNIDVHELLLKKFLEYDPNALPESVERKLNNWFGGTSRPDDRNDLIKICFALGLDENLARSFMRFSSDGDFHLRNPREISFLYCLRSGKTYQQAVEFVNNLYPFTMEAADSGKTQTKLVAEAFAKVKTDDAFLRFYDENMKNFGYMHNTAYDRFERFLKTLVEPDSPHDEEDGEEEKTYSIKMVVEKYLRMNLPKTRNFTNYTAIQKLIRRYWPNETEIKSMRNKSKDVSRKVLLLLYVATEGLVPGTAPEAEVDDIFWIEDMTPEQRMEDHAWRINLMLNDCGFSRLDPRNPFDWLILYSLKADDDGDGMSARLAQALEALYPSK